MILFNLLILKICRYFSLVLCEWELKRCTGFVEVIIKNAQGRDDCTDQSFLCSHLYKSFNY